MVLTTSDELLELRERVKYLTDEMARSQAEYNQLQLKYVSECIINTELQDLLRSHGIPYRDAIKKRGKIE